MNDHSDRQLSAWLREGPERGPQHGLERALAAARRTGQRPGWTFHERVPMLRLTAIAAAVLLAVTAGLALVARPTSVGGPAPVPTATSTPQPSVGAAPTAVVPPTAVPLVPATPLPDPAGSNVTTDLIGAEYRADPPEIQGTQELVLTVRAVDDPHCMAMFGGRSTCFTILWQPNYPKHVGDPGVRGPARLVDGNLVLGFALVPYDAACEGTSSTYTIEGGGASLRGVDVPACSFQAFTKR